MTDGHPPEHDDSQQPRDAIEGRDNQQDHPDYVAGWTVQGDESGVTVECPDLRRHHLTNEEAVALAEFLLDEADTEDNDK